MPNSAKFAKALFALDQVGCLDDPACRGAVAMFVRQASEDKRFHLTTHYRSTQAAKLLAAQRFDNASQYHHWCCRNLRHEHMVPVGVVIDMILRLAPRSEEAIGRVLVQFSRRATITREQDKVLGHARLKTRMPDEFWVPGSALYQDPLARYHAAGLGNALVERREASWFSGVDTDVR